MNPQLTDPVGRLRPRLTIVEREAIMVGVAAKKSIRAIAKELGRHPSTVMREIALNGGGRGSTGRYRRLHRFGANRGGWDAAVSYQAHIAQARARSGRVDPNWARLGVVSRCVFSSNNGSTASTVPRQIAGVLAWMFPDDPEMRVSTKTIYRALYVQGRAEVEDRAVPRHWEGDLIMGKDQHSQVGTLVERSSGFVMLLHLPENRHPAVVAQAIIETMRRLPATLRRTLTWDQCLEMAHHAHITMATDMPIYFCDPHSPWQL